MSWAQVKRTEFKKTHANTNSSNNLNRYEKGGSLSCNVDKYADSIIYRYDCGMNRRVWYLSMESKKRSQKW